MVEGQIENRKSAIENEQGGGAMAESPGVAFRSLARRLLGESLLLALLVTFFAIVAVPEWEAKGYEVIRHPIPILEDLPPEIDLPPKPEAPQRPEIPIEGDDDDDLPDDTTIPPTLLVENDPISTPALPELPRMGEFVARDTEPRFVKYVVPEYPELARKAGVEGDVVVNLLLDTKGRVVKAVAVSGPEILRDSAVNAALQCLLTPALQRDKPVAVWVSLPFRFRLTDAQ